MAAIDSKPNPFIFSYEGIAAKEDALMQASLDLIEASSANTQASMKRSLGILHHGLENRIVGYVSLSSKQLQETAALIPKESPLFEKAQKVSLLANALRKGIGPLLGLYETAAAKVTKRVEELLAEKELEDTEENRSQLLAEARESVPLLMKERLILRYEDLNQAAVEMKSLVDAKVEELLEEQKLPATQENRRELLSEAYKSASQMPEWDAAKSALFNAISRIESAKEAMDAQIKAGKPLDAKTHQVYEAVMARIEEVDADGALRHELHDWSGHIITTLKDTAIALKPFLPHIITLGVIFGVGMLHSQTNALIKDYLGEGVLHSTVLAGTATGLYHAIRMQNMQGIALSGTFLINQLQMFYQYTPEDI